MTCDRLMATAGEESPITVIIAQNSNKLERESELVLNTSVNRLKPSLNYRQLTGKWGVSRVATEKTLKAKKGDVIIGCYYFQR